jgi:hypothetical protein
MCLRLLSVSLSTRILALSVPIAIRHRCFHKDSATTEVAKKKLDLSGWDTISEIVGAIAVVTSLILVGVRINRNTAQLQVMTIFQFNFKMKTSAIRHSVQRERPSL